MIDFPQAPTPETAERDAYLLRTMGLRRRITPGTYHHRAMASDNFTCVYCGTDLLASLNALLNSSIDHVVPKLAGGTNEPSNPVASCTVCNHFKGRVPVFSVAEGARVVARYRAALLPLLHEQHEIGVMRFSSVKSWHVASLEEAVRFRVRSLGDDIDGVPVDWKR